MLASACRNTWATPSGVSVSLDCGVYEKRSSFSRSTHWSPARTAPCSVMCASDQYWATVLFSRVMDALVLFTVGRPNTVRCAVRWAAMIGSLYCSTGLISVPPAVFTKT